VNVGLQGVGDVDVQAFRPVEVLADVPQRVHGNGLPAVGVRDQEGGISELWRAEEVDPWPRDATRAGGFG
jgi:hypothetical protein